MTHSIENLDVQNNLEGSRHGGGRELTAQYIRAAHTQFLEDGRFQRYGDSIQSCVVPWPKTRCTGSYCSCSLPAVTLSVICVSPDRIRCQPLDSCIPSPTWGAFVVVDRSDSPLDPGRVRPCKRTHIGLVVEIRAPRRSGSLCMCTVRAYRVRSRASLWSRPHYQE